MDSIRISEAIFKDPPNEYRPLAGINFFKTDPEELVEQMADLNAKGFGGVVVNVGYKSFDDYLKDEKQWKAFGRGLEESKRFGFIVWVYDEPGYPSGTAGKWVLDGHPEFEQTGLIYVSEKVSDGGSIVLGIPEGKIVLCSAYKISEGKINLDIRIDLKEHVKDGKLTWVSPTGQWLVAAFVERKIFEGTHAWFRDIPYLNIMDKNAVQRFVNLTHEDYARRFSDYFGTVIKAFVTDEPSLPAYVCGIMSHPFVPWHRDFLDNFKKRKGYDLLQYLPALFTYAGEETPKVRCDFWDVCSQLCSESYFKQIRDWCKAHNVASTGHLLSEELLSCHVACEGDLFMSLKYFDIPGMDLLSVINPTAVEVCKFISSVAHIYGHQRAMSETSGWSQRPIIARRRIYGLRDMMQTISWQYVLGINVMWNLFTDDLPMDEYKLFNDFVGRLGFMLTRGRHIADIAILYPITSVWANFVPTIRDVRMRDYGPELIHLENIFQAISRMLLSIQRDYDYINDEVISKAKISGGKLQIQNEEYKALILPSMDTIKVETLRIIKRFFEDGGMVLATEPLPRSSAEKGRRDRDIERLVEEIFDAKVMDTSQGYTVRMNEAGGKAFFVHENIEKIHEIISKNLTPDLYIKPSNSKVYYLHRQTKDSDIYFIYNNGQENVVSEFTVASTGTPEVWNPETGKIEAIKEWRMHEEDRTTSIKLQIEGFKSTILVLSQR